MGIVALLNNKFETFIEILRNKYKTKKKKRLKNTDFSLIASNCNGGVILHDLGLRFNTPFINLFLLPKDFIKLIENFNYYMAMEVVEIKDDKVAYPVGFLGDIRINFMHYNSFEEAKHKWDERKQRINYDNLFFMLAERDGCTLEDLRKFDSLHIDRKVVFTHKKYSDIKSSFYIKGFEKQGAVLLSMHYPKNFSVKRFVDQFDFVKWVNGYNHGQG